MKNRIIVALIAVAWFASVCVPAYLAYSERAKKESLQRKHDICVEALESAQASLAKINEYMDTLHAKSQADVERSERLAHNATVLINRTSILQKMTDESAGLFSAASDIIVNLSEMVSTQKKIINRVDTSTEEEAEKLRRLEIEVQAQFKAVDIYTDRIRRLREDMTGE